MSKPGPLLPPLTTGLRRAAAVAVLLAALPLLLHLPGMVALGIGAVSLLAGWSALTRPLPEWLRVLLVLLVTGAVLFGFGFRLGRDAGIALLLAMLVLKLCELRDLADARRLAAYALFSPFAAFLQDTGPLTLVLGLGAGLGTLWALGRLARAPDAPLSLREEAVGLGRSAMLALPLALVGFWLFPRLASPLWGLPENAVARIGVGDTMSPGDWLDLLADDRPAFRVRFDGPTPPSSSLYWRGPVLTRFDGRSWSRSDWFAGAPPPTLPQGGTALGYTLTLEPTDRRYVFALESPGAWPAALQLGFDASLRAPEPQRSIAQYRFTAVPPAPYQPELPETQRRAQLALPAGFNPRSLALASAWRNAAADDRAFIQRVLRQFNAEFIYSLDAPPLGRHSVDEFLFDTRRGFCEHYASSFVFLMRAAGIPSRVVMGYVGGVPNRFGDYWTVRNLDAHAWAEVWLPGEGWLRVDPTAAVAPERIFDTVADLEIGGVGAALRPMLDFGDSLREAWNNFVVGYNALRQVELLQRLGWRDADRTAVGVAFVLAAGMALGLTLLVLLRAAPRERDPLLRAWRAYLRRWQRRGFTKRPDETALAFAARVRASVPEAADDLDALVAGWQGLRYAAPGADAATERETLRLRLAGARPPALSRR